MNGIFAVYKPKGITSHDVVDRVRKLTGVKRVGHGGTLDPLAEGVLVIAVGRENTKLLDQYVKGEKEYVATIKLGEVSETDDSEGSIHLYSDIKSQISDEKNDELSNGEINENWQMTDEKHVALYDDIESTIQKFIGEFPQIPPKYSAKKIGGRTAYKMARRGLDIKLEPKIVKIMDIKIELYYYPYLIIRVTCGSGVYIRSLARDIGEDLETGAYLADLKRTRVNTFTAKNAIPFEKLGEFLTRENSDS